MLLDASSNLLLVRHRKRLHRSRDLVIAQRSRLADQRKRGSEALHVLGKRADVGFVEVIDVENQPF